MPILKGAYNDIISCLSDIANCWDTTEIPEGFREKKLPLYIIGFSFKMQVASNKYVGWNNIENDCCINKNDNTFKNVEELKDIFKNLNLNDKIAFTCGSGMTACVLGLANSLINGTNPIIYDESWSGYGLINNDNKK